MKVLGMRVCMVEDGADDVINFMQRLGLEKRPMPDEGVEGAVFNTSGESWLEIWQQSEQMPGGTMLQLVVDDADAFAERARTQGLLPQGPVDAHGEHIYFIEAPNGLKMSFQSSR